MDFIRLLRHFNWVILLPAASIITSACLDTTDQVAALAAAASGINYDFATHPLAGTGQGLSSTTVVISSVTAQGGTGTSILIVGTGFASGATVTVGALNCPVTALTSFLIQCTAPANAAGAAYDVTVTNTDASTATSSGAFTQNATPTLTSIAPNAAGSGTTITLTGTNFNNAPSAVRVGGTTCTSPTYSSATSMTCVIPMFLPTATAYSKSVDVVVTNPDGQTATLSQGFTYVYAATQIASGTSHTCALINGGVKCWGKNNVGQLGHSTTTASSLVPLDVPGLTAGVSAIAAGGDHSCAIISGIVKCWGRGTSGQLGNNPTALANENPIPVTVVNASTGTTPLSPAQAITAGTNHSCAIVSGGAWCWGLGTSGQLGNGAIINGATIVSKFPVQVLVPSALSIVTAGPVTTSYPIYTGTTYLQSVSEISAGGSHTCALTWGPSPYNTSAAPLKKRIAVCWGLGTSGQLGDNLATTSNRPVMVTDSTAATLEPTARTYSFQHISAGGSHTCGIQDGSVLCWGFGTSGQLGNGSTVNKNVPVSANLTGAQAITAGANHTCAIINGVTSCWGDNTNGQLGLGNTTSTSTANSLSDVGAVAIAAGGDHTCSIVASGIQCWGTNASGELGNGTMRAPLAQTYFLIKGDDHSLRDEPQQLDGSCCPCRNGLRRIKIPSHPNAAISNHAPTLMLAIEPKLKIE